MTLPSGRVVTTAYDTAGRAAGVTGVYNAASTTYASGFSYWPNGMSKSLLLGNGVNESTAQDIRLRVTGKTAQIGANTPLLNLAVGYNSDSNVASEQITRNIGLNITQTFTPDAFDRLLSETEAGGCSQTYLYDANGNRAVQSGSCMPNPNNTPTAASAGALSQIFSNTLNHGRTTNMLTYISSAAILNAGARGGRRSRTNHSNERLC